jgi:hypothetical protein
MISAVRIASTRALRVNVVPRAVGATSSFATADAFGKKVSQLLSRNRLVPCLVCVVPTMRLEYSTYGNENAALK